MSEHLRRAHATAILADHDDNSWDGSTDLESLIACHYAVVVKSSDYSWVLAADDAQEVAAIIVDLEGGEDIGEVYDLDTGAEVEWTFGKQITVTIGEDTGSVDDGTIAPTEAQVMETLRPADRRDPDGPLSKVFWAGDGTEVQRLDENDDDTSDLDAALIVARNTECHYLAYFPQGKDTPWAIYAYSNRDIAIADAKDGAYGSFAWDGRDEHELPTGPDGIGYLAPEGAIFTS